MKSAPDKAAISKAVLSVLNLTKGYPLDQGVLMEHLAERLKPLPPLTLIEEVLKELEGEALAKSLPGELPGADKRWILGDRGEAWVAKNRP